MQLGGLGVEVLPHRIGALVTYRQQDMLLLTDIIFIKRAIQLCPELAGLTAETDR